MARVLPHDARSLTPGRLLQDKTALLADFTVVGLYCTFDLNFLLGPRKSRIIYSSQ